MSSKPQTGRLKSNYFIQNWWKGKITVKLLLKFFFILYNNLIKNMKLINVDNLLPIFEHVQT